MDFHNNNELDAIAITQAYITDKTIFRKHYCDWDVGLRNHEKTGNYDWAHT